MIKTNQKSLKFGNIIKEENREGKPSNHRCNHRLTTFQEKLDGAG
jgi:hypothetical protein